MKKQSMKVWAGDHINKCITQAMDLSGEQSVEVHFDFNDVKMIVCYDSNPELLLRDFNRPRRSREGLTVGPYPPERLSAEQLQIDIEAQKEIDERAAKRSEEYKKNQDKKQSVCEEEIGNASIELSNPVAWNESKTINSDGYGGAVISYAERWAKLMQVRIAYGKPLSEIAEQAGHDADVEGITGFMYGCAVGTLSRCWKHGEELRRWHNLDTQIGSEGKKANEEGGVLNPALLNIG